MAKSTGVEWTNSTLPLVQGCDPVSPGCTFCYAILVIHRLANNPNPKISTPLQGLVEKHKGRLRWTGKIALREDRLSHPFEWKGRHRIFIPSHGDLFHKDVPFWFIDYAIAMMMAADWHVYQVLTKRPDIMAAYFREVLENPMRAINIGVQLRKFGKERSPAEIRAAMPLKHVHLGFSAEDQDHFDERWPAMRSMAEAGWLVWVSAEPLLGQIDMARALADGLAWVVVGGESGAEARPMHPAIAAFIRDQCISAGVPFFFKQQGTWVLVGDQSPIGNPIRMVGGRGLQESMMMKVGRKRAGKLLEGESWTQMPPMPDMATLQVGLH